MADENDPERPADAPAPPPDEKALGAGSSQDVAPGEEASARLRGAAEAGPGEQAAATAALAGEPPAPDEATAAPRLSDATNPDVLETGAAPETAFEPVEPTVPHMEPATPELGADIGDRSDLEIMDEAALPPAQEATAEAADEAPLEAAPDHVAAAADESALEATEANYEQPAASALVEASIEPTPTERAAPDANELAAPIVASDAPAHADAAAAETPVPLIEPEPTQTTHVAPTSVELAPAAEAQTNEASVQLAEPTQAAYTAPAPMEPDPPAEAPHAETVQFAPEPAQGEYVAPIESAPLADAPSPETSVQFAEPAPSQREHIASTSVEPTLPADALHSETSVAFAEPEPPQAAASPADVSSTETLVQFAEPEPQQIVGSSGEEPSEPSALQAITPLVDTQAYAAESEPAIAETEWSLGGDAGAEDGVAPSEVVEAVALEPTPEEWTPAIAAAEAASEEPPTEPPEAAAAMQAAAPQSEPVAPDAPPHGYFRAAGDPDEPETPPLGYWQRQQERFASVVQNLRDASGPGLSALFRGTKAFAGGAGRGLRNIKHPRNVREAAVWGGWAAAAVTVLLVGFFFFVTWGMPSTDDLWEARNGQSITFLDRRGNVILREGAQNAPPVDLESLPPYVAEAFIAIEDQHFYQHWGVDLVGMMRAGAENLRAGRVVQGGSTITQQLAKNLFLTNERSWRRKAQEIALAIWLETKFSKQEILALYLSRVYFGAGAYGIEAAAERYFDRPARELTLLQSAMIAGLVKAPSRLNPARQDIEAARSRASIVLGEMVRMDFIADAERQAAMQEELTISRRNPAGVLAYYRDWIDPLLNEVIGNQLDDFIVETTIDIQSQRTAAESVEAVLAEQGQARRVGQAALVSMDDEGGVIAMVGGRDYEQSQFNRVTQARRQPGSSFKYFIYLAAMEHGLTPWSVREDGPITIRVEGQPDWTPGNYEEKYHGPSELAEAFQHSYNMVAIRVAHEVGRRNVIEAAERLGVHSQLHDYPSLALGAQEVTLLEMTGAYGAMASQGYRVEPHGVVRIRRANSDETMWGWRERGERRRVIDERPLRYMNYLMTRVVAAGTGTRARIEGRQIGGKTGTGNDYRDAWFVGFTPGIVTGVWVGNDNFTETARVTGGSLPADIWARFMPTALRNVPVRELEMPRPEDYDTGAPAPNTPALAVVGAPLGGGAAAAAPADEEDRSLDFGPEG